MRFFAALGTLLLLPLFTLAQSGLPTGGQPPFLRITPKYPEPGQTVTVFAETYSFPGAAADTVWTIDGETVEEGLGIRQITATMPSDGTPIVIRYAAEYNGEKQQAAATVTPSVIDVIIEGDAYAPVWYEGGMPPRYHGSVRLVAFPTIKDSSGRTLDPDTLVYTWRDEDKELQAQSGYGKRSATVSALIPLRSREVTLRVASRDGSLEASRRILIKPRAPEISLYRVDPLLGIVSVQQLMGAFALRDSELTLIAEPFGVEGLTRSKVTASYSWSVAGRKVESGNADKGTVTLRTAGQGVGVVDVEAKVSHPTNALLSGIARLGISFENN